MLRPLAPQRAHLPASEAAGSRQERPVPPDAARLRVRDAQRVGELVAVAEVAPDGTPGRGVAEAVVPLRASLPENNSDSRCRTAGLPGRISGRPS